MAPQVEADLAAANSKFLQLHGPAGGAELDLYGRAAMLRLPHNSSRASFSRAESERDDKTGGSTAGRIRSEIFVALVARSPNLLRKIGLHQTQAEAARCFPCF